MAEADSWETVDLAALTLKPAAPAPAPGRPAAGRGGGGGSGRASYGSLEAAVAAAREAPPEEPVDAFLREALQRGGGDRLIVLKYDLECEKLARALRRDRAPLPGPLSSFQRQAARRVAAHYGLAVEATPEDGGLALCRTGATRVPSTRLQDVAGPARAAADDDAALGLGLAAGGAGPEGGPPRVVGVMRRSPSASGASDARAPAAPAALSVEEREAAYERARERILGASTAEAPAADDATQQPQQPPPPRENAAQPAAAAASFERERERDAAPVPAAEREAPASGAAAAPPPSSSASAQRRAVMRDREKDLADPDFARPAPPMMSYGGGMAGGPAGPGPYGFGGAPYGDMGAPYGGGGGMAGGPDFPPLGAAAGNGGARWSGGGGYGGGGGGYWPPLGAGGPPAQGAAQGRYGYAPPRGAPGGYGGYGAPAGRGGAPAGRNGW